MMPNYRRPRLEFCVITAKVEGFHKKEKMLVFLEYNALMIQYINMKKEKKIRGLPWTKSTISTLEILVDKIKRKLILIPYCLQFNTEKKFQMHWMENVFH